MRIVIGVDGSAAAEAACRLVADRPWPASTTVELLAAHGAGGRDQGPALRDGGEVALEASAAILSAAPVRIEKTAIRGHAAPAIAERASVGLAQLVVVGSRGLGPMASAILGSVSAHLVDHAPCPVLVVRSPAVTRMVLATDGTESSRSIPSVLASWGNAFRGLPVEVVSVVPRIAFARDERKRTPPDGWGDDEHAAVAARVASEMSGLGWQTTAFAAVGDPEREILSAATAWDADLIVTGSRGLGTLRRLVVGSVSHDLLLHGRSSLLVVRGHAAAPIARAVRAGSFAPA